MDDNGVVANSVTGKTHGLLGKSLEFLNYETMLQVWCVFHEI